MLFYWDRAPCLPLRLPTMGTSGMLSNGAEGDREAVEGGRLKGGTIKLRRSRHHHPLNPLNLHTEGVSKGAAG